MKFWRRVGGWWQRWHHQGGVLRVDTVQDPAERAAIVERNREIAADPAVLRDLSFGRCVLTIPVEDYYRLRRERPELASSDHDTHERAWRKFLASSDADEFRLQPRGYSRLH